jgi:hypothetical protein
LSLQRARGTAADLASLDARTTLGILVRRLVLKRQIVVDPCGAGKEVAEGRPIWPLARLRCPGVRLVELYEKADDLWL